MKLVRIVHPEAGESMVSPLSVPQWRESGWEVAATADTEPQDEAPAEVLQAAETIGAALARHGVVVTGAATIAAAYDVLAAHGTAEAAEQAQNPAEPTEPASDAGNDPAGSGGEPAETGAEPAQHEAKPERRTRRSSPKESE